METQTDGTTDIGDDVNSNLDKRPKPFTEIVQIFFNALPWANLYSDDCFNYCYRFLNRVKDNARSKKQDHF